MISTPNYLENTNTIYSKPFVPGLESYLSKLSNNGTSLPLWNTSNAFEKQYFQVEVMTENEVPLKKSADDVLNMNTYTCNICNTEVPKSYLKEHNNGDKHKTCMKITDIALERTREHMKTDIKPSPIRVTDTYFCEPCAIIVQNIVKTEHNASKRHLRSLMINEILKEFLMVYEDKDNIDIIIEKYTGFEDNDNKDLFIEKNNIIHDNSGSKDLDNLSENKDITSDFESKTLEQSPKEVKKKEIIYKKPRSKKNKTKAKPEVSQTDNIDQQQLDTVSDTLSKQPDQISDTLSKQPDQISNTLSKQPDQISEVSYIPENSNQTKAEKKEQTQKASNKLIIYLKNVAEKCKTNPIHTIEALTDKVIVITAINGDRIKVPAVNFHSIHKQKDKRYCMVCEYTNIGPWHEDMEEHMEKLMLPIEDMNAIRKIDDIWSHCILCNDLTKNITFHLQSLHHRNKLKQCLIVNGTDINQNIVHKDNPKETSQLIQEHSLIISHDNTEISCNICEITIPNKNPSIKTHIETFDHITKYNTTIENNKLNEIDNEQYYCIPCDMCVSKCYALGHCNGNKHNKYLAEIVKKEEETTQIILPSISQQIQKRIINLDTDSDLICFVCNIVIYNIDNHMNSLEHQKNYLLYLEANKLNEIKEDTFFCIPCNTVISIDYLMSHCTSKKHKVHLKNFLSNDAEDISKTTGQVIAENTHISRSIAQSVQNAQAATKKQPHQNSMFNTAIPIKFLYQFREMSNTGILLCTICDEEVPYTKNDVKTHVKLIGHVVAFNLMMLWNKIKRMNDKYFCDICKVNVTYFNELSHVTGGKHVELMAKQIKGTVYEYDKALLTIEYAMSHKVGNRVRPRSLICGAKQKNRKLKP